MSGSTEHQASGTPKRKARRNRIMNLTTARKMLPLVQRIVADLLDHVMLLNRMEAELEILEKRKRQLNWTQRSRRYTLQEEMVRVQNQLQAAIAELSDLSVVLMDEVMGRVGFPTIVNNRAAYFAWSLKDETINTWHFDGETRLRIIPPNWIEQDNVSLIGTK